MRAVKISSVTLRYNSALAVLSIDKTAGITPVEIKGDKDRL